jgi:NAD+ kinase
VGVLAHPLRPETAPVAERVANSLRECGVNVWVRTHWEEVDVRGPCGEVQMVVAIGGDGAMLRAARACAPYDVPVLGINMGMLGFLTEIHNADNWEDYVDQVLAGDYWIEERMMVRASVLRNGRRIAKDDALNDIVIGRGGITGLIRLEAFIDRDWATTYNGDALIIATPTGSTAYALACGGPILPPELSNILIVPVAPHLSMDRPIVLSEGAVVEVIISPDADREIAMTIDGRVVEGVRAGDHVRVQAGEYISRFIRMRERNYFYRSLLDKLEPRITPPTRRKIDDLEVSDNG